MNAKPTAPLFAALFLILVFLSCARQAGFLVDQKPADAARISKEIEQKTNLRLADGIRMTLWASDTLAPDPIAICMDAKGAAHITRTNRIKNSEQEIRSHRDWMGESITFKTIDDRRDFLHRALAPENSDRSRRFLKDMNGDGSSDWRDLTVEKEEIWRVEDRDGDGIADRAKVELSDFNDEISDVAGGLLIREKDAFVACAPDLWRLEDSNHDGVFEKKTSISHGYGVHIGFTGHNLSGVTEGLDGRIYWNIGDIGGNITTADGQKWENPNSGFIARSEPDGSGFEIFATGLRNTHEFAFDNYGNLIAADNDGDHAGESERLVHVVEGMDAGWRTSWQFGKYTDPRNNRYNPWMDERLWQPRWDGQASYITPPLQNFHNGPCGFVFNPGSALGAAWQGQFFMSEFDGTPDGSRVWAFSLKPDGASFQLEKEMEVASGFLPTGMSFGPDGALYVADWVQGWGGKDRGRIWRLDVAPNKNDLQPLRDETKRLLQVDFSKQKKDVLFDLLAHGDQRIRKRAQFELARRGEDGAILLKKAAGQGKTQFARLHGLWGLGQMARADKKITSLIAPLTHEKDPEVAAAAIKMLGEGGEEKWGGDLISFLKNKSPRVQFAAAEAVGKLNTKRAVKPLIELLDRNDGRDLYIQHAAVVALSRIEGKVDPILALKNSPKKSVRLAAVLVLRRLKSEQVAEFLKDADEQVAAEAARAINDDEGIPAALPALAATLDEARFTSEPLLRRAINAALRVGSEKELGRLVAFSLRPQTVEAQNFAALRAEAFSTLENWADPSPLDRVDGRFRGAMPHDAAAVRARVGERLNDFFQFDDPQISTAAARMVAGLGIAEAAPKLAEVFEKTTDPALKAALLPALGKLRAPGLQGFLKKAMADTSATVRRAALTVMGETGLAGDGFAALADGVFQKGEIGEQQAFLEVLPKLDAAAVRPVLSNLTEKWAAGKLSVALKLELGEAIAAAGDEAIKNRWAELSPKNTPMEDFSDALWGGDGGRGRDLFFNNQAAQCARCHAVGGSGGRVGPDLSDIGRRASRDHILQSLVEPSAKIAAGFGAAGAPSSMPAVGGVLSRREVRDLVAYLSKLGE